MENEWRDFFRYWGYGVRYRVEILMSLMFIVGENGTSYLRKSRV